MLRINWDTVGRIIKRVCDDDLDPGRVDDLCDIGIDEVSWKHQNNYLTLVAYQRRQVVWGCNATVRPPLDEFFSELDPPPDTTTSPRPEPAGARHGGAGDHGPVRLPPDSPASHGIPVGANGSELDPAIFAGASRRAVSMT